LTSAAANNFNSFTRVLQLQQQSFRSVWMGSIASKPFIGFWLLCMAVRFLPTRLTAQQRARMRRMLQAFDGHRAGATGREIAQVMFRTGALDRSEWQTSSVRYAVKALIRDARTMIAGGYRKLLRHRRVS
jgi:hypothetical protein